MRIIIVIENLVKFYLLFYIFVFDLINVNLVFIHVCIYFTIIHLCLFSCLNLIFDLQDL